MSKGDGPVSALKTVASLKLFGRLEQDDAIFTGSQIHILEQGLIFVRRSDCNQLWPDSPFSSISYLVFIMSIMVNRASISTHYRASSEILYKIYGFMLVIFYLSGAGMS